MNALALRQATKILAGGMLAIGPIAATLIISKYVLNDDPADSEKTLGFLAVVVTVLLAFGVGAAGLCLWTGKQVGEKALEAKWMMIAASICYLGLGSFFATRHFTIRKEIVDGGTHVLILPPTLESSCKTDPKDDQELRRMYGASFEMIEKQLRLAVGSNDKQYFILNGRIKRVDTGDGPFGGPWGVSDICEKWGRNMPLVGQWALPSRANRVVVGVVGHLDNPKGDRKCRVVRWEVLWDAHLPSAHLTGNDWLTSAFETGRWAGGYDARLLESVRARGQVIPSEIDACLRYPGVSMQVLGDRVPDLIAAVVVPVVLEIRAGILPKADIARRIPEIVREIEKAYLVGRGGNDSERQFGTSVLVYALMQRAIVESVREALTSIVKVGLEKNLQELEREALVSRRMFSRAAVADVVAEVGGAQEWAEDLNNHGIAFADRGQESLSRERVEETVLRLRKGDGEGLGKNELGVLVATGVLLYKCSRVLRSEPGKVKLRARYENYSERLAVLEGALSSEDDGAADEMWSHLRRFYDAGVDEDRLI